MRGASWRHKWEAPKRYESLGDCKNLSVSPQMQSQIAFVQRRPSSFRWQSLTTNLSFYSWELKARAYKQRKALLGFIARDFNDQSAMHVANLRRNTTNLPRVAANQRGTVKSSRQFDGVFVSQNANRLLELLDLKRLL